LPVRDLRSPGNCCSEFAYEIQLNLRPAIHPQAPAAMGIFQTLPDSATGYARRLQCAHPDAPLSPFAATMQSDSPAPAKSANRSLPFPAARLRQMSGLPSGSAPNLQAETSAAYVRYGITAIALRSRIPGSSLFLPRRSAKPGARCSLGDLEARANDRA